MRPPGTAFRLALCTHFLLLSAYLLQPPLAAAQEPQLPSQSQLTPDVRSRLTEAARDAKLEPWQREFMLGVARGNVEGGTAATVPGLFDLPPTGIASIDGDWTGLNPPSGRYYHTAIYDPVRDRMVVFGGIDNSNSFFNNYRNDVWSLSLGGSPAWSNLAPTGTPPSARYSARAIYDPVRDRMLVFGGFGASGLRNDVWALSFVGPAWSELAPAGTPPSARFNHSTIYDPVRDRMLVFGGYDGSPRNDVWALSLAGSPAWNELAPAGTPTPAREDHSAIYDPVRDRMVVFGGYAGGYSDAVWVLSFVGNGAWSELTPVGTPPPARGFHTAIFDPVRDRMLVFGGNSASGYHNDVWALSLAGSPAWSELTPAGTPPSARYEHSAIYDPVRDRMVVFGGDAAGFQNDLWSLSLAGSPAWSELAPSSRPPDRRHLPAAIYDPLRDRMVVFGGYDDTNFRNDVWALSLVGIPTWGELAPTGTPPTARFGPSAIYDPVRDRMVVYGGYGGSFESDVWALSLAGSPAWIALGTSGTPPAPRYGHTAIYDPVRDRMVVYAGFDGTSYNSDVWELSLAGSPTWTALATAGGPPSGRVHQSAIYEPVRDRMVMFGGTDQGVGYGDVWALSLAWSPVWSALAPAGTPPSARQGHSAIYDPVRDRMVVFGDDVWALSLAGSTAWSELAPAGTKPPGRAYHVAIYDPVRYRMVAFGGRIGASSVNDAWALAWTSPVSVPGDGIARRFEFALPRPNPSRGETTLDFALAEPARVVMEAFDTQGRRVRQIADAWFTSGRHASRWRGDDENGNALGAGMYFIRMQVGGVQTTRRTVQIR